ncbi:hypothetical protein Tco_0416894, partial [Tanacetum coccineum]
MVNHQSTIVGPPVNGGQRQSTTTGPPVNGGQRRRSTAVNDGQPPPDHRSTVVDRQSTGGSRARSGRVMGR